MVLACPTCGARYWEDMDDDLCVEELAEYTDGYCETDPPADVSELFYCPRCDSITRHSDARDRGQAQRTSWLRLLFLREAATPPPQRYVEAINAGIAEFPEQEIAFRLEAWRLSNHPFRRLADRRKPGPADRPAWWRESLRAVDRLVVPQSAADFLLLAELARELGEFAECLRRIAICERMSHESESARQPIRDSEECADPELIETIRDLALESNPFVQAVRPRGRSRNG